MLGIAIGLDRLLMLLSNSAILLMKCLIFYITGLKQFQYLLCYNRASFLLFAHRRFIFRYLHEIKYFFLLVIIMSACISCC
jgi:hypothetical protein